VSRSHGRERQSVRSQRSGGPGRFPAVNFLTVVDLLFGIRGRARAPISHYTSRGLIMISIVATASWALFVVPPVTNDFSPLTPHHHFLSLSLFCTHPFPRESWSVCTFPSIIKNYLYLLISLLSLILTLFAIWNFIERDATLLKCLICGKISHTIPPCLKKLISEEEL